MVVRRRHLCIPDPQLPPGCGSVIQLLLLRNCVQTAGFDLPFIIPYLTFFAFFSRGCGLYLRVWKKIREMDTLSAHPRENVSECDSENESEWSVESIEEVFPPEQVAEAARAAR